MGEERRGPGHALLGFFLGCMHCMAWHADGQCTHEDETLRRQEWQGVIPHSPGCLVGVHLLFVAFFCGPSHANSTPTTLLLPLELLQQQQLPVAASTPPPSGLFAHQTDQWETLMKHHSFTHLELQCMRIHLNQCTYRSIGPSMLTINQHDIYMHKLNSPDSWQMILDLVTICQNSQ